MKNRIISKITLILISFNILGIILYLFVASQSWDTSVALTGRLFFDDVFLRPFWIVFCVINGLWLIFAIGILIRFKKWTCLIIWMLMAILWIAVYKYDLYHFSSIVKDVEEQERAVQKLRSVGCKNSEPVKNEANQ